MTMTSLIFHHYPNSPFSEKIRLIFGYKKLAWQSVIVPTTMPKPDVLALTGGYRRTPILQIGAHVYCDTALIADKLEALCPTPSLYPVASAGVARHLAQWADSSLFWAAITHVFQPAAMPQIFANVPPEQVQAFGADRAAMRGNAPRMSVAEATGQLEEYLRRTEATLANGQPYLLGNELCIADFSVYQALWLVRRVPAVASILQPYEKLLAWMDRVASVGHGASEKMKSEQAIQIAKETDLDDELLFNGGLPLTDYHQIAIGKRVAITPTDYALDPVEGSLLINAANEFAVLREDERAGQVIVHFPRIGFQMKPIKKI